MNNLEKYSSVEEFRESQKPLEEGDAERQAVGGEMDW